MRYRRVIAATLTAAAATAAVAGCSASPSSANQKDTKAIGTQLDIYQRNQPIPQANFSQLREALRNVENAQIHGIATTSFFFNQGASQPYKTCPSIGYPIASTSQLTNPQQIATHGNEGIGSIPQMEPNGVFTGDSTGTYVVCVDPQGIKYIDYAEGFVHTEGGPAHFDKASGLIVADGAPTVTTQTGK